MFGVSAKVYYNWKMRFNLTDNAQLQEKCRSREIVNYYVYVYLCGVRLSLNTFKRNLKTFFSTFGVVKAFL